jgi:hypothetical protein
MTNNRWIENSRSFFALLLKLYPRDHRDNYAVSMLQVFTEQCRTAFHEKGISGIFFLWLRTLPDLGYTAVLEHFASPRSTWGLMEPVPNAPLPWRGVFLILLPAMVYLVSQIAQLIGEPWYLTVYYRAAFFLIIPPALVWVITRRFPIWGLIPLGLLFRLLQEIGYMLVTLHPNVFSSHPLLNYVLQVARVLESNPFIMAGLFAVAILLLGWRHQRRGLPARWPWLWIGIYLTVALAQVLLSNIWIMPSTLAVYPDLDLAQAWLYFWNSIGWSLYTYSALLLLVFLGTLFTRRHGMFAILVTVGYLLPTMVIGTPWSLEENPALLVPVIAGVLVFRVLLSLVMPVWMSRSSTQAGKRRVVIGLALAAFTIHAAMQFIPGVFFQSAASMNSYWVGSVLLEELRFLSALLLGLALYQEINPLAPEPSNSQVSGAYLEIKTEKA